MSEPNILRENSSNYGRTAIGRAVASNGETNISKDDIHKILGQKGIVYLSVTNKSGEIEDILEARKTYNDLNYRDEYRASGQWTNYRSNDLDMLMDEMKEDGYSINYSSSNQDELKKRYGRGSRANDRFEKEDND